MSEPTKASPGLTPEQQLLNDLWEEHLRDEFQAHDTDATIDTMVPDAYVNGVPVMTGGGGREGLRDFYARLFIPRIPPGTEIVPVSRTIGTDRLVDEFIFCFTHTVEMEWMLPGVPPTGKRVEVPMVVIVQFREGSWPTNTFTGTRLRSWFSWGFSTLPACRSRGWKRPGRC
jgi:carboxymethylenebutenolidase